MSARFCPHLTDAVKRSTAPCSSVRALLAFTFAVALAAGGAYGQADTQRDSDGDRLPDAWEINLGLDASSSTGSDGRSGDPDGDGRTNAQEYEAGTHPRGFFTRYLAEGATSAFFDMTIAIANPNAASANVVLLFHRSDGTTLSHVVRVAGRARQTVVAMDIAGLGAAESSNVAESDQFVVIDRTMTWGEGEYGSHAETSIAAPSTTWYLAEGATHSGFSLFYLIYNPNPSSGNITVTYLLPSPAAPLTKTYSVKANSRFNIWVNNEAVTDPDMAALAGTDLSARITSDVPVVVERAMYLNAGGLTFGAGHESAGVTATAMNWFLAEGATGDFFDLFILIANPNPETAQLTATYLLPSGATFTKNYTVAGNSRFTIWIDQEEFPAASGNRALANTAVSTTITSTNGVGISGRNCRADVRPPDTMTKGPPSRSCTRAASIAPQRT